MTFLVDANTTIGTNTHMEKVSDVSLRKVDPIDGPKHKMHVLRTNVGGGGTREGLDKDSSLVDWTITLISFLTTTCGHHGTNCMM